MSTTDDNARQPRVDYHEHEGPPEAVALDTGSLEQIAQAMRTARQSPAGESIVAFDIADTALLLYATYDGQVIVDSGLPRPETLALLRSTLAHLEADKD